MMKALSQGIGAKVKNHGNLTSRKSITSAHGGPSLRKKAGNLKISTNQKGTPSRIQEPNTAIDRLNSARPTVGSGLHSARAGR